MDSAQLSAYLLKVLRPHLPAELWAGARAAAYMFLLCVIVCVCVCVRPGFAYVPPVLVKKY
eukprot:SAG25_NODE_679_length_5963_cov_10.036835_4_plen_61_part_00